MKRLLIGWFCLLLSGAAAAANVAAMRKQVESSVLVTGTIVVAPDGHVAGYALDRPEKLAEPVVGLIGKAVPWWRFQPVLLAGKPVTAKARMSLRIVARRTENNQYELGIHGVNFGDGSSKDRLRPLQQTPPRYPQEALHARVAGTVYLVVQIDRQGQVRDVIAQQVNLAAVGSEHVMQHWRDVLANASIKAARQWVFDPAGASADEFRVVRAPIAYALNLSPPGSKDDGYGRWDSYVPGPQQPVPWFDKSHLISDNVDALPSGGVYPMQQSLTLMTPLNKA
jgi:hypothetical protein